MDKRQFIKQSVAGAVALGTAGKMGTAFAKTNDELSAKVSASIKRTLGKTGFEVFPVVYGGIVSSRDGQAASDNYVACKTTIRTRVEAEKEFEESLRLLHTDYFDVFQLHSLTTSEDVDRAFAADGVIEMIEKEKQRGRIRKVGFSAHSQKQALRAMSLYDFDTVMFPINWQMDMLAKWGSGVANDAKQRGMGVIALKGLIHRKWLNEEERETYPKSWCKPIDVGNPEMGIAALKYTFMTGADVIIPPGDFRNFAFCVDHIDEILNEPITIKEKSLLDSEFLAVKDYPFFDPQA